MSKIVNTLKKGTGKAKMVIVCAILAGLAAIGFIVLAIILKQLLYFFGTVVCIFITISLKQTLDVYEYQGTLYANPDISKSAKEKTEAADKAKMGAAEEADTAGDDDVEDDASADNDDGNYDGNDDGNYDDTDVASLLDKMNNLLDAADAGYEDADMEELAEIIAESEEEAEELHKHRHKRRKKDKNKKNKAKDKSEREAEEKEDKEEDEEEDKEDKKDKKKWKPGRKNKKDKNDKENKDEKSEAGKTPDKGERQKEILDDELEKDLKFLKHNISGNYDDKPDNEDDDNEKKLVVVKQASDEEVATYDKKKIKHTMHKYKVKKDHRLILIDYCDKYYIKQTPAYVWVSDKEFNILLIEQEPRHLILPLYSINEITYLKKCPVNADTDYPIFHKRTLLTDTFRPYLPDYTQSTVVTDLTSYKNLYGFGPGIYCTNRSAKNLFDLLSVEFRVDDKVTMSNKVNIYFKECYKAGILLRDNVIDANGYADMISHSLDDMAKSTVSNNEFRDTLNLLVRNKIITKEFSNHYMDVRNGMARS